MGDRDDGLGLGHRDRGSGTHLLCIGRKYRDQQCVQRHCHARGDLIRAGYHAIPTPDYFVPSSFGGLELKPRVDTEFIGQPVDYSPGTTVAVQKISIDALSLPRVDLLKLDIGGMESEALEGALQTIKRCRPIFLVESIKTGAERLRIFLDEHGYKVVNAGINNC